MNRSTFLRQLRYWTFHCTLNALPSFCIAMIYLGFWDKPAAVMAMLLAITTFIFLYATLTSINGPLADQNHILARSLRLGTKIRAWVAGLSVCAIPTLAGVLFTPDYWCGVAATIVFRWMNDSTNNSDFIVSGRLADVYLTTLIEGFFLSILLFIISFIVVIFLHTRAHRAGLRQPRFR